MSEVKKIATRVSYGNALVELAKEHDDVYVLDADLAAATQTAIFKKEFPDRHIDCGIAECNMMGIAAGIAVTLREGTDVAIIATGLCVAESLAAAEKLAADGVNAKVINIHTIKPLDEELVVAAAKECGRVVTVEEHSVIGGLGAAVCETLSRKAPTPVKTIGIQDCFGESGPAVALLKKYGLDAEGIYASVKDFL